MAFALTGFQAYGMESDEAVTKKFVQYLRLDITAANTDTALDLGTYAGTFWTAVGGTEPGATALKTIKDIQTRAKQLVLVSGEALINRDKVLTVANANEYSVATNATNTHLPDIAFHSGDAPTSYSVYLMWDLNNSAYPIYLNR